MYPFKSSRAPWDIPTVKIKNKQTKDRKLLGLLNKSIDFVPLKKNSLNWDAKIKTKAILNQRNL